MSAFRLSARLAAAALALAPLGAAGAQLVVPVYEPAGAATTNDAFAFETWIRANVRPGGSVGITTDYARSGNGSAYFSSADNVAKADLEFYVDPSHYAFARLGFVTGLAYDYFRDVSSTAAAHLAPALRLRIDADGNVNTANDRGYLVYEPVYNGGGAIAEGVWNTASIGATTNLWWFQSGVGVEEVYNRTLATYRTGAYTATAGFAKLGANSLVLGLSTGVGSGWAGTYEGAVDNVTVAGAIPGVGAGSVRFNYEVASVPEPSTYALMGSGLLALAGVAARRRKQGGSQD